MKKVCHRVESRGKSGAGIEFGNELLLAEQVDGFITDWQLYEEKLLINAKLKA